jgi:hypothetical protein
MTRDSKNTATLFWCFFVAVYSLPQADAGTKTALNELYFAISKQEDVHPEAALLVAGTLMQGNSNPFYLTSTIFYQHQPEEENKL